MAKLNYDTIKEYLRDVKGQKESSVTVNISRTKKVMRELFGTDEPKLTQLKDKNITTNLINHLDTYNTSNAKKTYMMSMIHALDAYGQQTTTAQMIKQLKSWTKMCDAESVAKVNDALIEKLENINFDEIRKSVPHTRDGYDRIIKACYTMCVPLRQQDWCNLKISNKPLADENHINLKTGVMTIYHHKSDRTHGTKEIELSKELMEEIKHYKRRYETDVLLPMTSSAISRRMTRLFGCGSGTLRKAYVSQNAPHMKPEELLGLADQMGHKISTQLISYRKQIKAKVESEEEEITEDTISETSDEPTDDE